METGSVLVWWKRFREKVCNLLFRGDVKDIKGSMLKMISDKVIANINMLRSPIISLSIRQCNRRLIVCKHDGWLNCPNAHLSNVIYPRKELTNRVGEGHVFRSEEHTSELQSHS